MGVAWAVVWIAPVVFTALIVFLLQNTRSVEVSFLGLHGTFPLAMVLLIAMVGGIVLTVAFGPARIASLRHVLRKGRSPAADSTPWARAQQLRGKEALR